jgi:hypothetical protein
VTRHETAARDWQTQRILTIFSLVGCAALAIALDARADDQDISQAANDPTASLMALQFSDWHTTDFHNLPDESDNTVVFRPVIPFSTGDLNHIFRATIPVITDNPFLEPGLSDMTVFDLVVFSESWGRWGVGAVGLLPTGGSASGAEKWGIGPAVGFTARNGKLLWGAFNQNIFTIAGDPDKPDVNVSLIQPILSYSLGDGWSVGLSEMSFAYDWDEGGFTSLPLGVNVAKMVKFGTQPVQFSAQYEHNYYDEGFGPSDTVRGTVKFLFPVR